MELVMTSTDSIHRDVGGATDTKAAERNGDGRAVWTIHEAAAYLSVPVNSLYKMTGPKARLRVPHIRIAGRLRFRKADLDRWLDVLSVSNLDVLAKVRRALRQG
jgi:excisionase family DNA binding protein